MNNVWYIYKDGQERGPYTAEHIRQALREGTLDPFDLVAREGSTLRREIVEVDDLFAATSPGFHGRGEATVATPGSGEFNLGDTPRGEGFERTPVGQGHLMLADAKHPVEGVDIFAGASPAQRGRRDPKQYFLTDSSDRLLGPLSVSDIKTLYYRGVLKADVRVLREGSASHVNVPKFISMFAEQRGSGGRGSPQPAAHPSLNERMPLPRRRRPTFTSAATEAWSPIAIWALAAGLMFIGAAVMLVLEHGGKSWFTPQHQPPPHSAKAKVQRGRHPDAVARQRPRLGLPGPAAPLDMPAPDLQAFQQQLQPSLQAQGLPLPPPLDQGQPEGGPGGLVITPEFPATARSVNAHAAAAVRRQAAAAAAKAARKARLSARALARPAPAHEQEGRPSRRLALQPSPEMAPLEPEAPAAAPPSPAPAPAHPPAARKQPAHASGGSIASLVDGSQVQHFGPVSFDPSAIGQCQAACSVTFRGEGGTFKGAFFKQVWGPKLEQKGGSAYVSGSVRKSGGAVKIILSDVQ